MQIPFDTLEYVETLEKGGFNRTLAENHAKALLKLLQNVTSTSRKIDSQSFLLSILEYSKKLIDAGEKPQASIVIARKLTKDLAELSLIHK